MQKTRNLKTTLTGFALIGLVSSMANIPVMADEYDSNVRLFLGQKHLDDGDWNSLDRQNEIGLISDTKKTSNEFKYNK